ncbi:hypothetical protein N510_001862 [Firmicutes bacterium ASF500]|nr:hypothetical protein N510_001862 [Firmicutes bacterium ASF500]
MDDLRRRNGERFLLSLGLFLLNAVFFTLALATLLFVIGVPVGRLHFPAAVLAAGAAGVLSRSGSRRQGAAAVLAGLAVLALCLAVSGYVDDWSWDGNTYHKGITGALTWGWNPLRESFYAFAADYPFLEHCTESWYDAYPKATELFGACVHSFTGNIEAGKASGLLLMAAGFFLGWGLLLHTGLFKGWQSALCAGLAVVTPVSASQMFTYYNDGTLANMLLLCLMGLLYFTFHPEGELRPLAGYLIFASISIGFNLKFSSTLFFAVLCLTFFGFWTAGELRQGGLAGAARALRGRFCLLAGSVLSGVLFLGATSYVTNTIRYRNPVYTMIGEGSTELITSQLAPAFQSMGNLGRFTASLFSRTNTSLEITAVEWKLPFTVTGEELICAPSCDVRTAGWGVLFSGIFLISAAVIVLALVRCRRSRPELFRLSLLLSAMLALSILFIPGLSWARYFTALFLVPVAAMLFLFAWWNRRRSRGALACGLLLAGLLCGNLLPNAGANLVLMKNAGRTWSQLAELKELTQTQRIGLGYSGAGRFEGRMFNIYDAGITNFFLWYIPEDPNVKSLFDHHPLYYFTELEEEAS